MSLQSLSPDSFQTFGDLLKYVRRREHLTQLELSIAVGYSDAQITRLEKNQRRPDIAALKALFIPALHIEDEPEIIARLLELAQSSPQEETPAPGIAPYKGLLFFDEADAALFFGRETLTAHLAQRVAHLESDSSLRFLTVVGASGSGKSSLLRAGLVPAFKLAGWDVKVFTPGPNPSKALEMQLGVDPDPVGRDRLLVIVDQFEETFTLCHDESERSAFIEKLLDLGGGPSQETFVVIALRADFYSHCAQYAMLRQAIAREQEYIGQMTAQELRRAIEEPAKLGGWELEPGLVDLLLNDIGAQGTGQPEPGALPLLSHALLATWEHRRGRKFTRDGYYASGGVRGAIAETAESVFNDQLDTKQQELARDVFLRLTELGDGTEDTRRRAALNELVRQSAEATQLRGVLNTLSEARLITLNENSAEVAHEALIREWQRLREWLTQDREGLLLHRRLTESAREWEARGREPSELYRGARLAQVREWSSFHRNEMNVLELEFLTASVESNVHEIQEREAQRQRELEIAQQAAENERARAIEQELSANRLKLRNRLITTMGALAFVLAILAGAFGWTSHQNELRAEREQRASVARELAAASLTSLSTDPERSALLALQAIVTTKSKDGIVLPEAADALYRAAGVPHAQLTLQGQGVMDRIIYSPDGKVIAAYDSAGFRRVWNVTTGQELFTLPAVSGISLDLAFTSDSQVLVASDLDEMGRVAVSFWSAKSGTLRSVTHLGIDPETARLSLEELSEDGARLALVNEEGETTVWDTSTGKQMMKFSLPGAVTAVVFSRDDSILAAGDRNEVTIWDIASGREVRTFSKPNQLISSIDFSPDGTRLAASNYYSLVWVWDLRDGKEIYTLYGHTNTVNSVHFNTDGTRIATSSSDHKVMIWDASSGVQLQTLAGHANTVRDSAFSPDGKHIATASEDHAVKIWDYASGGELPSMNTGALITIFDSEQKHVALSFSDRPAELWDFPGKRKLFSLSNHAISWVYRFSADGKRVASKSPDGTVSLWDATNGTELWVLHATPVGMVIPSPDGMRVAIAYDTGADPGVAEIWDVDSNRRLCSLSGHEVGVWGLAYSPDGKRIATGDNTGMVKVWDAETCQVLLTLEHSAGSKIRALVFSPDGKYLASGSQNGLGKIWDSRSGALATTLVGHTSTLKDFAFSPDDMRIATAGYDGTLRTWDAHSGTQAQIFYGDGGGFWTLAYTSNGKRLVAATDSGVIRTYLLDIDELVALTRAGLTRQLSEQECQQYLHRKVCPTSP